MVSTPSVRASHRGRLRPAAIGHVYGDEDAPGTPGATPNEGAAVADVGETDDRRAVMTTRVRVALPRRRAILRLLPTVLVVGCATPKASPRPLVSPLRVIPFYAEDDPTTPHGDPRPRDFLAGIVQLGAAEGRVFITERLLRGGANEHPETITRTTMIRTLETKLISRPDGLSELYDLKKDPRELHNVHGDKSYDAAQSELERRLLTWYVKTSDVAPRQLDPRGFPSQHKF